jgi:hypothetical protein
MMEENTSVAKEAGFHNVSDDRIVGISYFAINN